MKIYKSKCPSVLALLTIATFSTSVNSADFDVLGGTFFMIGGAPPVTIEGDGNTLPVPGYPTAGRMVTDSFLANFACADFDDVNASRAQQCETATNGTPSSPTASGPDDDTATRNGLDTFNFFGVPTFTYFAEKGVDFPAVPHPPPSIDIVSGTADMSSWYASWNGTEFHQGSYDSNNHKDDTTEAIVTANPDGSYTVSWQSLIVGGPFNGIVGVWDIDVCPSPCQLIPPAKAPSLEAEQNASGVTTRTLIQGIGDAVVSLNNGYDITGITFDWQETDPVLLDVGTVTNGSTLTIRQQEIDNVTPGLYRVFLEVTDTNVTPNRFANATLMLNILATDPGVDMADSDNDGIPNVADSITDSSQLQTDETTDTQWLMTASDGVLKLGDTAYCSGRTAASVSADNIAIHGGVSCTTTTNYIDNTGVTVQTGLGGIFDFEVHGLDLGQQIAVVIPLKEAIRTNASYRKYSPITGWHEFDQTGDDSYQSTSSTSTGICPSHDADSWQNGLVPGMDCLKLLITDGGPNDADNGADGILKDPGAMSSNPDVESTAIDLGYLNWSILVGLFAWLGLIRRWTNR